MEDRPSMEQVEGALGVIPEVTRAPWSREQVKSLNDYQVSGAFHPFTHLRDDGGNEEVLVASEDGWHCPEHPDFEQDWAWPQMADGTWKSVYIMGEGS